MTSISAAGPSSKLFVAGAASAAFLALAACGGGGGATSSTPQRVVAASNRPCNLGLSSTSAGNGLETIARPLPPASPAPPSPQPTLTIASSVRVTTTIVSNAARFAGRSGLTQLHSVEADSTALQITSVASDSFVNCPSSGSGDYLAAGWSSADSNGVTLTLSYGAGNGLIDILPEMVGASWTNSAAQTLTEVDADGQTTTKSVNPDGSYGENSQYPDGTTSTAIEHSDGSGSYSIPFGGPNAGSNDTIDFGTPNPAASGGPAIPIVILAPSASPQSVNVPDWYPPGPLVLAIENDRDLGPGPLPAACHVPPSVAASVNQIVRTTARLDTIFGEIEHDVSTVYTAAGAGVVCTVLNNQLTAYYDYSGQGPLFSGLPQQVVSFAETIGVQSLTGAHAAAVQARSLALRVDAAQQRFTRLLSARHASQLRGLMRRLRSRGVRS